MATVDLLPDSEGTIQRWSPYPVTGFPEPHWNKVDDPVGSPDEDATYVYVTSDGQEEDFNHATSSLLEGVTITNVRVTARCRKTSALDNVDVDIGLRIGITRYPYGASIPVTTSYDDYWGDWANNPANGNPWTKDDIDNLQSSLLSIVGIALNPQLRCTQVYITVTYTPAAAKKPRMGATVGLPHII